MQVSQDQQAGAGAQNLPLPAEGHGDHPTQASVGSRHHIYSHGTGIPVPRASGEGIMHWYPSEEGVCDFLAPLKHCGRRLLC